MKPNPMQVALMRAVVVSDREIMRGTPVFKGTRIPWTWLPICLPRCDR